MKIFVWPMVLLVLVGCSATESTFFRKHGASREQERIDWGLCGGNFLENRMLEPSTDPTLLNCMRSKGYSTFNEYYYESKIEWRKKDNKSEEPLVSLLKNCGVLEMKQPSSCEGYIYLYRQDLPAISTCLNQNGYEPSLPRQKGGIFIFDKNERVDGNFCLYLSPRNKKGGISFGAYRLE